MRRILSNLFVASRQATLRLILKIPQDWRSRLSSSRLLTRVYLFFDRAKYQSVLDAEAWRKQRRITSWTTEYVYSEPRLTPEVEARLDALPQRPLISVLTPVYNTRPDWLQRAIASLEAQWYPNWELCIADDHSDREETRAFLGTLDHPRIRVARLPENCNIAAASNEALALARGEYVALMDHDDELTPDALFEVVCAINGEDADFIYSDEDKLDPDGLCVDPHFKPDFAPDQFLSQNYLSHLGVIHRELVERVGGFTAGTDGAQDYDLYLKVLEHTDRIVHIPKVLYHWRRVPGSTAARFSEKSHAQAAGRRALQAAIARRQLDAQVENGLRPGTYRVKYRIQGSPLVSIVIPFRDKPELIRTCVESILERSTWPNFQVIGISNNSEESETYAEMERLTALDERVEFHRHDVPFNFSAINNHAVEHHVRGEHVVLLNNDIEIISHDWLECLLQFSQREDVGAVGGKLYYPNGRIQHAGIVLGIGGIAGHSHKYFDPNDHGYFSRPHVIQNVSAVTAACCMVKQSLYQALGGLDDEHLTIAFNDVDFCLRLRERGFLNVFTPYCEAWHHESVSRGYETTPDSQRRFAAEVEYMAERHAAALESGDPYYSPHLTLEHEDFSLAPRPVLWDQQGETGQRKVRQ